jgi:hypothetical protein
VRSLRRCLLFACLLVSIVGALPPARALAGPCAKVAAPGGSDSGGGSESQPYLTARKLVGSLGAGETGCLRAGTYAGDVTISRGGSSGAPITLTSYPGERATIAGKLWVADSANFVTVSSLDLDGRNPDQAPSPTINGDDVTFADNDVTNRNTTICFDLGATTYGRANRTLIKGNRIHGCGQLPSTNFDHGIYVEHATAATIVDNQVYDNADRGIQLYPDAQRSYVARNVIDGNGEGILIAGGSEDYGSQASNDNVIEQNLITNSNQRNNVEARWDASLVGQGNFVRNNCIHGGALAGSNHGLAPDYGFTSSGNIGSNPRYVDRGAKDFRLLPDSPCLNLTGVAASFAAGAPGPSPRIVVSANRASASPGAAVVLTGKVEGRRPPSCVVLKSRHGKRWRRLARVRVRRNGHFTTKLRVRRAHKHRRSRHRCRRLRSTSVASFGRALKLSASAPGFGQSNTVRVRVRSSR